MADNERSSFKAYVAVRAAGWGVAGLMGLAIVYAAVISVMNWTQIAV